MTPERKEEIQKHINILTETMNINNIDQKCGLIAMSSVIIDIYRRQFTKEDLEVFFTYLRDAYSD